MRFLVEKCLSWTMKTKAQCCTSEAQVGYQLGGGCCWKRELPSHISVRGRMIPSHFHECLKAGSTLYSCHSQNTGSRGVNNMLADFLGFQLKFWNHTPALSLWLQPPPVCTFFSKCRFVSFHRMLSLACFYVKRHLFVLSHLAQFRIWLLHNIA